MALARLRLALREILHRNLHVHSLIDQLVYARRVAVSSPGARLISLTVGRVRLVLMWFLLMMLLLLWIVIRLGTLVVLIRFDARAVRLCRLVWLVRLI